jgi:hypothetical protein
MPTSAKDYFEDGAIREVEFVVEWIDKLWPEGE